MKVLQKILILSLLWKQSTCCPFGCNSCNYLTYSKMYKSHCSNQSLTTIPEATKSTGYKELDLSQNPFKQLQKEIFKTKGFKVVETLTLSHCQIEQIDKDAFKGIQNLTIMDLSNNVITNLHSTTFQGLDQLRDLLLSNNLISVINDKLFENMNNLMKLELNRCKMLRIEENSFKDLKGLTSLSIVGNDVTKIEVKSLEYLVSLKCLKINTDSWECDCRLKHFVEWIVRNKRVLHDQTLSCTKSDESLIPINNQGLSALVCKPVIEYPSFDSNGSSVVEYLGSVVLNCSATGDPMPELKWFQDSSILSPISMSSDGNLNFTVQNDTKWSNITVNKVTSSKMHNFTLYCKALSEVGNDTRAFKLVDLSVDTSNGDGRKSGITSYGLLLTSFFILLVVSIFYVIKKIRSKFHLETTIKPTHLLDSISEEDDVFTISGNLVLKQLSDTLSIAMNESSVSHIRANVEETSGNTVENSWASNGQVKTAEDRWILDMSRPLDNAYVSSPIEL